MASWLAARLSSFCCIICGLSGAASCPNGQILFNEVVYDTELKWRVEREFVELFDGGRGNTSLAGLRILHLNAVNGRLRRTFDFLSGDLTDGNGFYVLNLKGKLKNKDGILLLYCTQNHTEYPENILDVFVYEFKKHRRLSEYLDYGLTKEIINQSLSEPFLRQNRRKSPSISRCYCNTPINMRCFADYRPETEGSLNNCAETPAPNLCNVRSTAVYAPGFPWGEEEEAWPIGGVLSASECALRCFDTPLCDSFRFDSRGCNFVALDDDM